VEMRRAGDSIGADDAHEPRRTLHSDT
jgi:hypothetical protein